jgi:hypothetical protein
MSIATIITAIEISRNTIRTKLVELGLVGSAAKLDACAAAIEGIIKQGAISATVKEGETFNIPAGYHDGSGTVSGVGGGGNYNLQSKTVTPIKKQQTVTPDAGYFGLSDVIVQMIPDNYQDVSSVTAAAGDVLTGKIIVTATGEVIPGDMPNNGAVSKTLDATTITYSIPKGYHNGEGVVKITLEEKNVTPTKSQQVVTPTSGKVLSKVTVGAIPDKFQDTTNVDATPADVLSGVTYVDGTGEHEGSMPNNGAMNKSIDGLTTTSVDVPAGYTSGGTVALTDDIENALAAI